MLIIWRHSLLPSLLQNIELNIEISHKFSYIFKRYINTYIRITQLHHVSPLYERRGIYPSSNYHRLLIQGKCSLRYFKTISNHSAYNVAFQWLLYDNTVPSVSDYIDYKDTIKKICQFSQRIAYKFKVTTTLSEIA